MRHINPDVSLIVLALVVSFLKHGNIQIVLLGNADGIVQYLCDRLDWELPPPTPAALSPTPSGSRGNLKKRSMSDIGQPTCVGDRYILIILISSNSLTPSSQPRLVI